MSTTHLRIGALALVLLVATAACGDTGGSGNDEDWFTDGNQCESQPEDCDSDEGDIADADDFQALCEQVKECVGESEFLEMYEDIGGCVSDYQRLIGGFEATCRELFSAVFLCTKNNLQCTQGGLSNPPECSQQFNEFNRECSGFGN